MLLKIVPNMNEYQKLWLAGGALTNWNACKYAQTPKPANGNPKMKKNPPTALPAEFVDEEFTPNILLQAGRFSKRWKVEQLK
ncbi:MAG TPA: hypothetical protein VJQ54_24540 [Candidatus Sulfotelmatobacter sp.]|nr:hypothetical protein [Candidatus Sulfotelmatobacter sp.]